MTSLIDIIKKNPEIKDLITNIPEAKDFLEDGNAITNLKEEIVK